MIFQNSFIKSQIHRIKNIKISRIFSQVHIDEIVKNYKKNKL